jgi:4-amino-4-deoxy-L-arabinose transferase-like glycosyltransferase
MGAPMTTDADPGAPARRTHDPALLLAILAVAAFARFWQLDHGLPDVTRVDAFKFVGPAARWAAGGEFELIDYQYPGLYPLLLAGLYAGLGIESEYAQHLAACGVAAAFGVATALAAWLAAGAWCGTAGRALAAALVAVSPVLVTYARMPASDGVVAFFLAAALACLARWPAAWPGAAAAGACIGLATGTKFSGLMGLALVFATLALRDLPARAPRRLAAHAGLALLACGAAFWATTPWFFAHANDYAARLAVEMLIQSGGRVGRVQAGPLDYLLSATPTWEAPWLGSSILGTEGPVVLVAGLAAVVLVLWRRPPPPALAGAAVCVILALGAQSGAGHLKAIRFLAPLLPPVFVAIGWLVDRELGRFGPRRLLAPLLAAALLALPALRTARYLALHDGPPTQVLARAWIHASLPPGTPVFLAPFHLDSLDDGHLAVWRLPDVGSRQYRFPPGMGASAERDLIYFPGLIAQARRSGVQYFITNSFFDDAFQPVPENQTFFPRASAACLAFRERLEREATQVHEVIGFAAGRMGPDIAVWRLAPSAQTPGAAPGRAVSPGRGGAARPR